MSKKENKNKQKPASERDILKGNDDVSVLISAQELSDLMSNYKSAEFSATCWKKNYDELKAFCDEIGVSKYNSEKYGDVIKERNELRANAEKIQESCDTISKEDGKVVDGLLNERDCLKDNINRLHKEWDKIIGEKSEMIESLMREKEEFATRADEAQKDNSELVTKRNQLVTECNRLKQELSDVKDELSAYQYNRGPSSNTRFPNDWKSETLYNEFIETVKQRDSVLDKVCELNAKLREARSLLEKIYGLILRENGDTRSLDILYFEWMKNKVVDMIAKYRRNNGFDVRTKEYAS